MSLPSRRVFVILIIVIAVAGGGAWWAMRGRTTATTPAVSALATVEKGSIRNVVSSTARVVSNLDVDIKCKASGTIVKLPKDISDPVKEGDLLVELDPIDEQRAVAQAEAELAASQAKLAQARRQLDIAEADLVTGRLRAQAALAAATAHAADADAKSKRKQDLLAKALASQEDADSARFTAVQAEAERDTARAGVEALRSQELALELRRQDIHLAEAAVASDIIALDTARQRLKDTTVVAPITGVVAARSVQVGSIISSGITNVGGGTAVMTISDLSHVFALAAVDESDIGRVRQGLPVRLTADAFPGQRFSGSVVRIATRGVNASNVVTFEVKIEVTGKGRELLLPEMTTNVEIVVASRDSALLVPTDALTQKRDGSTVQVQAADGSYSERPVKTGIVDGAKTEVLEGLSEGERVQLRKGDAASQWRKKDNGMPPPPPMMMGGGGRSR